MPLIASIPEFGIDRTSATPLAVQLAEQIRQAVLTGRLMPESRLPSTRAFAEELGVSRATALAAYDQLIAEGYLEGRHGSGTRVAAQLPDVTLKTGPTGSAPTAKRTTKQHMHHSLFSKVYLTAITFHMRNGANCLGASGASLTPTC